MTNEVKYVLTLLGLGASLVAYAHTTFSTKNEMKDIKEILKTIDKRVYEIHSRVAK